MKAENRIDLNIDNKGKGRRFESRFLQAGLVKYSFGVCLLSKEVIDRFAYKFVGCPVIIDHKDITDANAKDERVGVISKVWYNEYDGWFWCEGVVFDDEAISLIKDKGYNVSCQYNIDDYTENTANTLHNGNPYDLTILDGTPEHLAIVKNPRYEEALIAVNKGEDMKAENTEFRTGYDSEGDAYVYPLEGADKSEKKETEKEDDKSEQFRKSLSANYSDFGYKESKKELTKRADEWREKGQDKIADLIEEQIKLNDKINQNNKDFIDKKISYNEYLKFDKQAEKRTNEIGKEIDKYKQATKSEDKTKRREVEYKGARIDINPDGKYADIKIYAPDGKTFANGDTWYSTQKLTDKAEEQAKEIIEGEGKRQGWFKKSEDKKEPKQLKLFNALEEQLERFVSLIAKNFDESKHDRDKDGKFTDSGNFSGKSVDNQEKELVKELKRLEKNGQDVSEIYKKLTGKEWGKKEAKKESKKENKPVKKSQKTDSVKFDKIGKVLTSILKDAEKSYKESK